MAEGAKKQHPEIPINRPNPMQEKKRRNGKTRIQKYIISNKRVRVELNYHKVNLQFTALPIMLRN